MYSRVSIAIAALSGCLSIATAQSITYSVKDLGVLPGGHLSQGFVVNNHDSVAGLSTAASGAMHATLWVKGQPIDIGSPGLGGPNSGAYGVNERGDASLIAESTQADPLNENFCAFFTGLDCLPAVWHNGVTSALPLLGGNNGTLGNINNRGQIPGAAENAFHDPDCTLGVTFIGTGPQVLDYKPVIWSPPYTDAQQLPLVPGDHVGVALWINDSGQAVGISGNCSNTLAPPFALGPHAVLWERDGSVHDLGNLGGDTNAAAGIGNAALFISQQGEVVGASATANNTTEAFLWTSKTGMQPLGTVSGDVSSVSLGINPQGTIVGASFDSTNTPRAAIWVNGSATDLNTLASSDSPIYMLFAESINASGDITGFGISTSTGEVHAFLATPTIRPGKAQI